MSSSLAMPYGVSQCVKCSADRTAGCKGLGLIWSCNLFGNLCHLWLTSGCSRGGETNETTPPEDDEAWAQAHTSSRDLDC